MGSETSRQEAVGRPEVPSPPRLWPTSRIHTLRTLAAALRDATEPPGASPSPPAPSRKGRPGPRPPASIRRPRGSVSRDSD